MRLKSDTIEIMINDEAEKIIKKVFDSFKNKYQNNLESVENSEFVFKKFVTRYQKILAAPGNNRKNIKVIKSKYKYDKLKNSERINE